MQTLEITTDSREALVQIGFRVRVVRRLALRAIAATGGVAPSTATAR